MRGLEGEEPVYAGELVRCVAHLHNAGSVPLRSLRLLIAQPELLCCPSAALLTTQLTSLSGERVQLLMAVLPQEPGSARVVWETNNQKVVSVTTLNEENIHGTNTTLAGERIRVLLALERQGMLGVCSIIAGWWYSFPGSWNHFCQGI